MRGIAIGILHALVAQILAQDGFVDNVVDEMLGDQSLEDLDETSLARAAISPQAKIAHVQGKLRALGMPPSPLEKLTLTAIAATRDIRAQAELPKVLRASEAAAQETVFKMKDALKINPREMAGISKPLGFWDPWGFTNTLKGGTVLYLQEAEIKHGRVCMLAFLGIIAGEKYHPFLGGDIDLPAFNVRQMFLETDFQTFWQAGLAALGAAEIASVRTQYTENFWEFDTTLQKSGFVSFQHSPKDRLPGELSFDPLGLRPTNPGELKEMQTKEINNGRLAMLAVAGILAQEILTGEKTFN